MIKKLKKQVIITLLFLVGSIYAGSGYAVNLMDVVPDSTTPITLSSTPQAVDYTVTVHRPVKNLKTPQVSGVPSYVNASIGAKSGDSGNYCAGKTLLTNGTCTFSVTLTENPGGKSKAGDSFYVRPSLSDGSGAVNVQAQGPGVKVTKGGSTPPVTTYTIGVNSPSNGTIDCTPPAVNSGGSSTCMLTEDSGYTLSALTDNGVDVLSQVSGNMYVISNITENHEVIASFSVIPITVTEPSLMFVNRNFGYSSGSVYKGTLTVRNTGSTTVSNIVATPSGGSNISYNAASPSGCATLLAAGSSCVLTFSSAIPLTDPTNASISITADGISTPINIPIASISVVALAPPLNNLPDSSTGDYRNFEGLTMVNGCSTAQILEITNNSNTTLTAGITASASSDLSGLTITNPTKSSTNNYCNGATLAQNQYCEITVTTNGVAIGATGTITLSGTGTNPVGIAAKVEASGATIPSTGSDGHSNTIFVSNSSCNLVEVVSGASDQNNNINWENANSNCSATLNSYSDWRFPDVGPTPGDPSCPGGTCPAISGEFATLYNSGTPLAGMSTSHAYWGPNIDTTYAWFERFLDGFQLVNVKSSTHLNLYVRCARAFTA